MTTYFMFGSYSIDAVKAISVERTKETSAVIGDTGGTLKSAYALLGVHDLVLIADFPATEQAMKASVGLTKLLGVSFTTAPAVTAEEFDKIIVEG